MTKPYLVFFNFFYSWSSDSRLSHDLNHDVVPVDHRDTRPSFRDPQLRFHSLPLRSSLKRFLLCSLDFTGFRHQLPEWSSSLTLEWKRVSLFTLCLDYLIIWFRQIDWKRTLSTVLYEKTPSTHLTMYDEHHSLSGVAMINNGDHEIFILALTLTSTIRCFIHFPKILLMYFFFSK